MRRPIVRRPIDPRHEEVRAVLRVVGPAVALVGLLFIIVGIGSFFSFFSSFGTFGASGFPRYIWCAFVGMPLMVIGLVISKFAFMGAIGRYMAGEVAPVGKDVVNYMAHGTQDAVREVAAAIGEGLRSSPAGERSALACPSCRADNEADASFCKSCGAPLGKLKPCPNCGQENDVDARFCNNCGKAVA